MPGRPIGLQEVDALKRRGARKNGEWYFEKCAKVAQIGLTFVTKSGKDSVGEF